MIQPQDAQEHAYVHELAALLIRARDQDLAGDREGAILLMDGYRAVCRVGTQTFGGPRNAGLVEFATVLSREEPRPERLTRFLAEQDARLADLATTTTTTTTPAPELEPAPDPTPAKKPARKRRTTKKEAN